MRSPFTLAEWLHEQSRLAELVAHDMRNPLQPMEAAIFALETPGLTSDEIAEAVADLRGAIGWQRLFIENSLCIARLENSGVVRTTSEISLLSATTKAMHECNTIFGSSEISIGIAPSDDVVLTTEPSILELMFKNLFLNSIRYRRNAQLVSVQLAHEDGRICVSIHDSGPPFGPFHQHFTREVQHSIKSQSNGRYSRGLGLYVVGLILSTINCTLVSRGDERSGSTLDLWFSTH